MELFKLLGTIAVNNSEALKTVDETVDKASKASDKLSSVFKKAGTTITNIGNKLMPVSVAVGGIGIVAVKSAAEVKAANSQFEQTFGDLQETAQATIDKIAVSSGILDTRLKGTATSIYAFAKSSGADSAEAMALMETSLQAAADSAAYYDTSLETAGETLMSFLKGNFANDAALGVSCTEFTRNAKAAELFGMKYNDLTEIQKQQTLLKMVTDSQALSGAMGQAARESDGFENKMGNLKESANLLAASFGEVVLPKVISLIQKTTDFIQKFSEMDEGTKKLIITIGSIVMVGAPALTLLGNMASSAGAMFSVFSKAPTFIGGFITSMKDANDAFILAKAGMPELAAQTSKLGTMFASIPAPVFAVVAAIGALAAVIITLWKTNEDFRNKITESWESVVKKFEECSNSILNSLNSIGFEFESISEVIKAVWTAWCDFIGVYVENIFNMICGIIEGALDIVAGVIKTVTSIISGDWESALEGLIQVAKGAFNLLVSIIETPLNLIKDKVNKVVDFLQSAFKFEWKLPKIKLPHFSINGSFSLNPPSVPSFGIEWYKKAMDNPMIMDSPTAFGINSMGQIMAGGEAGSEVVSGTDTLMNMISEAVAAKNARLEEILQNILAFMVEYMPQMANMKMVTDTGVLIGELAPGMDEALGKLAIRDERGI